jgi:NTE family protein
MSHPSGVVLSGGGANGAYEIGVLKALFRGESPANGHRPLEPGVIAATSIGAFNSTVLLSNHTDSWSRAVEALEKVWLEQVSLSGTASRNGVFRLRISRRRLARRSSWLRPRFPGSFRPS